MYVVRPFHHIQLSSETGPLIETITCTFRSRAECEEWHEKISDQMRSSRQSAVVGGKLSAQPTPPPHVSYSHSPPYSALTGWIRDMISANRLTHQQVRSLQKPGRQPCSYKVECTVSREDSVKSPVVLKEPNPFGYIHYIPSNSSSDLSSNLMFGREDTDSLSEEEMTNLLSRSLLNSSCDSEERDKQLFSNETEMTSEIFAPWGRRLPFNSQLPTDQKLRIASDIGFNSGKNEAVRIRQSISAPSISRLEKSEPQRKLEKGNKIAFRKEESPPNWISCFPSPKTKRKCAKVPDDVYSKSSAISKMNESPMKFIDKTPSANSLNLPYCPPVKLDYENFSYVDLVKGSTGEFRTEKRSSPCAKNNSLIPKRCTESKHGSTVTSSQLVVIPMTGLPSNVPPAPVPQRKHRSQVVAQIGGYVEEDDPRRCVCDSRRSSDSGLADMTCSRSRPPLSPPVSRREFNTKCSCGYSSQTLSELGSNLNVRSPLTSDQPPLISPLSKSLGDIVKVKTGSHTTLSDKGEETSSDVQSNSWRRTKEVYKTGLYAHWWLNASLQPISEEVSDRLSENL